MYIRSLDPTSIQNNSVLNVVANKDSHLTVKVLDVQGKMAKSFETRVYEGSQQLPIHLGDLNSGMYVLNAFCGEEFLQSIRFIKK